MSPPLLLTRDVVRERARAAFLAGHHTEAARLYAHLAVLEVL